METKIFTTSIKVLMFPWLAHGHISPYHELAKKLTKKNFNIFFCSTAINLSSIKKNCNDASSDFPIEYIELHLPNVPELPPCYHTTKGLPHNLASILMQAFQMSKTSFSDIITSLKPNLLIYDFFQPWAAEFASFHKVPSVCFFTNGAATTSYFYHVFKYGWPHEKSVRYYPFQEIFLKDYEKKRLLEVLDSISKLAFNSLELSNEIVLIKSCRGIEGKYLDYISYLSGKKLVPLGPLVQEPVQMEDDHLHIFNWLNKKDPSSVVLVSFGSEYFLSKEEIKEIAHGLELIKVNFIWVIRFPKGNKEIVKELVPEGFLERTKDTGIVVEGWIPQTKILQHPSIAAFMTHCGWGSIMETLYYGVPIIAMPMIVDQPTNARLLVDLGVAKEVLKDRNGKLIREEIAKVIKEIVMKNIGDAIKRKARELSKNLRMEEDQELVDQAIVKLQMICFKNMNA